MKPKVIDYLAGFPPEARERAHHMRDTGELGERLAAAYPDRHDIQNNAALYAYAQELKRTHLKSSPPLGKVRYSDKMSSLQEVLGLHTYAQRIQGSRLKTTHEIKVCSIFQALPPEFLRMVVVHELAHLRHKDHDKAFYRLCTHIEPAYHRYEADLRLMLFDRQGHAAG